jgi:DNA-binding MarR family transcriptional regulator
MNSDAARSDRKNSRSENELYITNILGAFSRALSDKMDEAVQEATGLGTSACYAIVQAGSEPNASIETLRRMLALEHSSVVRVIDRLETQGLVARHRGSSGDRREVSIALTAGGEDAFTRILEARQNALNAIAKRLSADDRKILGALITKMMPGAVNPGDDQHYVCRLCDLEACPQDICPVNLAHDGHVEMPDRPFRRHRAA